jgi:hypothetical protein
MIIRTSISYIRFPLLVCKNICKKIRVGMASYALGVKYCSKCEVYLFYKGIFCPCCGGQLRTKPLSKKGKRKESKTTNQENCSANIDHKSGKIPK